MNKLKEMLTEEEKKKLTFNAEDHEAVYRKIEQMHTQPQKRKRKAPIIMAYALTPIALVVMTFFILLQTPMREQVLAMLPAVDHFLAEFGDEGQKEAAKEDHVQKIEQSADSNGVRIDMNEILYDGSRISLVYTTEVHTGPLKGQEIDIFNYDIKVDGQDITNYGLSGRTTEKKDNKYVTVKTLEIEQELPKEFVLDFNITELINTGMEPEFIKGDWPFSINLKESGESYQLEPENAVGKIEEGEVKVKKITFAPSGMRIDIERKQSRELIADNMMQYKVYDENGNELKKLADGGESFRYKDGIGTGTTHTLHEPMKDIPAKLTIKPHTFPGLRDVDRELIRESIQQELPYYIPQGENGGVLIKSIEKKPGEVWVTVDVEGDFVQERLSSLNMVNVETYIKKVIDDQEEDRKDRLIKFQTTYSDDLTFITGSFHSRMD